jgi:hypothetical protein
MSCVAVRDWFLMTIFWLVLSVDGLAHPVSLSSAVVDVTEGQVRVELQIMLEDLVLYHNLASDGDLNYSSADLRSAAEKHRQFILDFFSILDAAGHRLKGEVQLLNTDQIEGDWIPQRELMQRFISMDLMFGLEDSKPDFLTFIQNFGGQQSALPAVMDLHVACNEVFLESAQIPFNRPHTVQIDWTLSQDGRRETLAELRKRRKQQFQARLGISSYSGLYSFLYIQPFCVRHEILIPVLSMEPWIPVARKHLDFLEVEEQQAAATTIRHFFESHGIATINGQVVSGRVERVNFFGLDINDFALNAEPRRVNVHQARVGIIVTYPSPEPPESVTFAWNQFNEQAPFIDTVLLIGDQKPDRFYFHPRSTLFEWKGSFALPVIEPVRENQPLSGEQQLHNVLGGLLTNVYRAFNFREDGDVYDALQASIHGDLLRQVYLRVKRSLLVAEQGGEQSQAQRVEVVAVRPQGAGKNSFEATWRVASTCEHWGHVHARLSEYRAELSLVADEGLWKIDQFQLLDEKRLQFETKIRGYDSN